MVLNLNNSSVRLSERVHESSESVCLLVSQLAPKYPCRQRHSLGLTHTSFSLQVKLPSQRAEGAKDVTEQDCGQHSATSKASRNSIVNKGGRYVRMEHSSLNCAHPLQHTDSDDLDKRIDDQSQKGVRGTECRLRVYITPIPLPCLIWGAYVGL